MSLKIDDPVAIDYGNFKSHGVIKEVGCFGKEVSRVQLVNGDEPYFFNTCLIKSKEAIEKGTRVVFYKPFDKVPALDGCVIHGGFLKDYIGDTGIVIEKHSNGLCKVLSSDFSWEYWIPEDSLFKVNIDLEELTQFSTGAKLYLVKTHVSGKKQLSWDNVHECHLGFPCEVLHFVDSVTDYPAYVVMFENGVRQVIYEGWLSEETAEVKGEAIMRELKPTARLITDNGTQFLDLGNGVRMFETGAVRSVNKGKPRFDLISEYADLWLAEELAKNAGTYGTGNYLLGIPELACVESLQRHLNTVKVGLKTNNQEMIDEAVNIMCNAMFLCHTIQLKKRGLYKISDEFKRLAEVDNGQNGKSQAA
jgi:hypothetical protein